MSLNDLDASPKSELLLVADNIEPVRVMLPEEDIVVEAEPTPTRKELEV